MKYILETTQHVEPILIPTVPINAKQEVCSENWKGEKSKRWVIDLKTIKDVEDLQRWVQENYEDCTGLIFLPKRTFDKYPRIEIYDDLRE